MNGFLNKVIRKAKWYTKQLKSSAVESWYVFCIEHFLLKENSVLLQSRYGDDLGGNIFYILKEMSQNYPDYTLYLAYKKNTVKKYYELLTKYNIKNVHMVELHKPRYWQLLATCKYLINDVTFHTAFIKRKGQVYLNTWHGTPLKKMGLEEEEAGYLFGNMQRNFLAADYLLCPNQYMTDLMVRAYSLKHLFRGSIVNEGYPRNAVFFDEARKAELRKELGLENLQVVIYMPTWRGNSNVNKSKQYTVELKKHFNELDEKLNDNQLFFVKLHPLVSSTLDLSEYRHIKPVPTEYETYDFLNTADCLVSDYSSIMFDFACTGRDIILFCYDEEEYLKDRGLYISISDLPFKRAYDIEQLIVALKSNNINYKTDEFIKGIIKYENKNSVRNICDKVLKGKNNCLEQKLKDNHKPNVYIFVDYLLKNGITASAFNLINSIDLTKRNYFFVFRSDKVKENKEKLLEIPHNVGVVSIDGTEKTIPELFAIFFYFKCNITNFITMHYLNKCYKRMFEKYYGNVKQDYFHNFVGYGFEPFHIFKQAKKKFVIVHNDMIKEIEIRHVQHRHTLVDCYSKYDKVAGVSIASTEIAKRITPDKGQYCVVHNCFDYNSVTQKSLLEPEFQRDTECTTASIAGLQGFLNDKGAKFITIGRFSQEKQHIRLLDAFNMYWKDNPDAKLIIIGGHGPLYAKTLKHFRSLPCWQNVCVIKSIKNPMPILRKCDLFILSSSNEGLPVVFFEADCLHKPILSTDIDGPHEFLNEFKGGMLVEESVEALYQGMLAFDQGLIKPLNIDMKKYNEQCIQEFESLFD